MRGWRPALRIARRDVLRSRGRSALVVAMVGLPVALVTALATLFVTNDVSPVESIPLRLGATQAELQIGGHGAVVQDPDGNTLTSTAPSADAPSPPADAATLARQTGGRVVDLPTTSTQIRTERGRLTADALVTDPRDRTRAGLIDVVDGRSPSALDEVLVTRWLAGQGYSPGRTIALADGAAPATVVGVMAVPMGFSDRLVVALPSLGLAQGENTRHRYLLDRPTPLLWPEVRRLNEQGVVVFSRAVVLDPPADWQASLPGGAASGSTNTAERAIIVLVIFSLVLEVVLLAGPAFAVGVRRQSRQLALVAAAGGTRRDVRRVVLAQAVVLGAGSAVAGAALGIGVAALAAYVIPRVTTGQLGPFDVDWRYVAAAGALGALASVAAALFPAISASRADVVAVLAGRRGQAAARRGWPVLGGLVFVAGVAITLTLGTRPGGEFMVAAGTLAMVLGVIALMPLLIGLVGRLGGRLPLPLRLATRDSARQRSRTAPAVAAVMAAVAGVTTLAIASSSDFEQSRRDYQPRQAAGVTTVQIYNSSNDPSTWTSVNQAAAQVVPGASLLAYGSVGSPTASTVSELYVPKAGCPRLPPREWSTPQQARCAQWTVSDPNASVAYDQGLVADPAALAALGYRLNGEQRATLDAGGVLLPLAELVQQGTATLTSYTDDGTGFKDVRSTRVRAAYLAPRMGAASIHPVVTTPAGASAANIPWYRNGGVLAAASPISTSTQDRLDESLRGITPDVDVYTERGFVQSFALPLVGLASVAVLIVLVGTLTATGLALADSRPDLTTLAAVGAKPRTRRVMAAAQALVIGLLGALTGVAVGVVPGVAAAYPLTTNRLVASTGQYASGQPPIIAIPWLLLLGVGLAVPAVAAVAAGLGVRSRLPLTRRLGQ